MIKQIKHSKKYSRVLVFLFLFIGVTGTCVAQENLWKNKKCAVVLTYDDALNTHLDNVIPLLNSLGIKATFYLPGYFPGFRERMNDWKDAANKGHELGNHTLFHPCEGQMPGREWVHPVYDLKSYTVERMTDEINMANTLLESIDGKKSRTFAYPCGDIKAGDSSYVNKIKNEFIAARGVQGKMLKPDEIDLYNLPCFMINNQSGDELVSMVKEAEKNGYLLVFLFHGVGGEHSINVSLEAHSQLLHYLKENEDKIYIPTMLELAEYLLSTAKH